MGVRAAGKGGAGGATLDAAFVAALEHSERRTRKLLDHSRDIVSLTDAEGRLVYTTATRNGALGYPAGFWDGLDGLSLVHPDDLGRCLEAWQESLQRPGEVIEVEIRMRTAGGHWVDIVVTGVNLLDDPDVAGIVLTARNVSDLRRAQRLSSSQAAVLELVARGAPLVEVLERCIDLVEDNHIDGRSSFYLVEEDRLRMWAGRAPEELIEFVSPAPRGAHRSVCDRSILSGEPEVLADTHADDVDPELRAVLDRVGVRSGWSQPVIGGNGEVVGTLSTVYDVPRVPDPYERRVGELACGLVAIALDRFAHESRVTHQALHDGLTGLPNRMLLLDRLDHALARRARSGTPIAVLFCDLDRFKVVNDSLGHNVGDQLLVAVAERLLDAVDPSQTVARFGGDEFVVLLEDVVDDDQPVRVAEAIAAALERPFVLPGGREAFLSVSIGLALAADHTSGDGWLRDADAAMYRAKERGRNRQELFDTEMREAAMNRLQVEHDVRRAVERDELVVHYQPIIDLRSGRICGAEALVRWQHPERGLLPPDDFIAVAEETGAIAEVGLHVLEVATRDMAAVRHRLDLDRFQLGVNLSARQLTGDGFDAVVDEVCRRHAWPHRDLLLEITETALTHGLDEPIEILNRIADLGVQLAIDDFGTGHSSLTRLGRMPVGQVKVDRSFVAAIDPQGDAPADNLSHMVTAVVAVATALDLRTSAEGVETQAQLDELRRIRCAMAQGYLFARPLPLDEFETLLAADPRW